MKTLGLMLGTISAPLRRPNVRLFGWLVVALLVLVVGFTIAFHQIMALEGRNFSWTSSVYWVLTVMSTLGFGDITFQSDLGRAFSIVVLVTGTSFILVLLPFAFIQFVFTPWIEARESARAPRKVEDDLSGHIILTRLDSVADALIGRARAVGIPTVIVVPDVEEAVRLHDLGYQVVRGDFDDPDTYTACRVEHAALVATTHPDETNTNIAFTVRDRSDRVTLVATANREASVDILELAGCDEVLQLGELLGLAMARRVLGADHRSHVIGSFGELRIAEVDVSGTSLAGRRVSEVDLRNACGINIIGIWYRGAFERVHADTYLPEDAVVIIAGSQAQLDRYDELHGARRPQDRPVLVLGGGRVGRAAARRLRERGIEARIVEQRPERVRDDAAYVEGDAADLQVLKRAGLDDVSAVLVTTHDDDVNVYLTLYLRRLREDLQVISRAVIDRNVPTLHRAGADAVLSYASLGANAFWNAMSNDDRLLIAEGLEVFQLPVPPDLAGRTLADADVGARTNCTVIALSRNGGQTPNPDPGVPLPADADLVVIGDADAEADFMRHHPQR